MLDFPPVEPRDLPPALTIASHIVGGASKTTTGFYVLDAAWRSCLEPIIFSNDEVPIFKSYGTLHHLPLAPTETVVGEPLADIVAHEAFDAALRKWTDKQLLHYDCAAASLNRHSYVMEMLNVADRVVAMGSYATIFVPASARTDLSDGSLETFKVWRSLFPAPHMVIPVVIHRDGNPRQISASHPLAKLVKLASDGVIVQPPVPMSILTEYRRTGMKLWKLADSRDPLDTTALAAGIGLPATILETIRSCVAGALGSMDPQLQRLGFYLGL
jgi:hypothetical protein